MMSQLNSKVIRHNPPLARLCVSVTEPILFPPVRTAEAFPTAAKVTCTTLMVPLLLWRAAGRQDRTKTSRLSYSSLGCFSHHFLEGHYPLPRCYLTLLTRPGLSITHLVISVLFQRLSSSFELTIKGHLTVSVGTDQGLLGLSAGG